MHIFQRVAVDVVLLLTIKTIANMLCQTISIKYPKCQKLLFGISDFNHYV